MGFTACKFQSPFDEQTNADLRFVWATSQRAVTAESMSSLSETAESLSTGLAKAESDLNNLLRQFEGEFHQRFAKSHVRSQFLRTRQYSRVEVL